MEESFSALCFWVFILFIWIIFLHRKISNLTNRVEELLSSNNNKISPKNSENLQEQNAEGTKTQEKELPKKQPVQTMAAAMSDIDYLKQAITVSKKETPQQNSENTPADQPNKTYGSYETKTFEPSKQAGTSSPIFEFTAAKLFSWIGGFMLFLGVAFCIKYSIEHSLISPAMRIVLSVILGMGLATWGFIIKNEKYRITSHTLLGSGFAIMYIAIYCSYVMYHFITIEEAFIFMAITSFIALIASLKKEAKYVGYLGAIIAFLTPILLRSGNDVWIIFFSYVFFINMSSAFAAVKKNWTDLFICTLCFTWLCQAAWFIPFASYKILGVVTFFSLYALASAWLIRKQKGNSVLSTTVGVFLCMELFLMLPIGPLISDIISSAQFLGYVLFTNLTILFLVGRENLTPVFSKIGKVLSFFVLFAWFAKNANTVPLWFSLGICVLFTAINASADLLPVFNRSKNKKPDIFSVLYPLAIVCMFLLVFMSNEWYNSLSNFGIIFTIMNIFLAALIILGALSGILWVVFFAVAAIFLLLFVTIFGLTPEVFTPCAIISSFVPLFLCGGVFYILHRKGFIKETYPEEKFLSFINALMPFVFIITIITQLAQPANLHWLLGATTVICILNILVSRLYRNTNTLPIIALGAGLVEILIWNTTQVNGINIASFTSWVLVIFSLFIVLPFINKKHFWEQTSTWIATAVAGLIFCYMGCMIIEKYTSWMPTGTIPTILFAIYAYLLYLLWGKTKKPQGNPASIAFISAACLFFLTIIFPIEIKGYWLSVAWVSEALFLSYLNKKLPYKGWQIVSGGLGVIVGLWAIAGIQELLPVPETHIWNWYLWVYGICALCFGFIGFLWEEPKQIKTVFYTLCGITLFWLLNIEIAQWFNSGNNLDFAFTGHLAEALTYTLAWALFGSTVIGLGLFKEKPIISKIGIGIMVLPLAKFLLSDIWQLELLYRILGSFALAVILILVSFWYQKRQKIK